MAFGGLFLTAGLSAALVWQSLQSRVVPYVVEVDRLGEARSVAPATHIYDPTDPQIAWHLGRFISNVRSRSLDPVLMRENWLSAYDFAGERSARFLGEYARADNPFAEVGRRTVSVQVTSMVRASGDSFRVNWTESEYERGALTETSQWTAMVTVRIQTPRSADVLRRNPLGLYVEAIDWSRELDAAGRSQARSPAARPVVSEQRADLPAIDIQRDADLGLEALPNERNVR
jgi:type IV secretory pathway TrbF-like protein